VQVGRYRFLDRLAVGGMAEVFIAVAQGDEGFEKPVVIKRLLPELASVPRFQQMFLDEARIMLSLQHGNIVQILDMGRMEGVPFLAIEYVHGKDLRTILQRAADAGSAFPHALSAHIVREACRALDYAHRKTDDEGRPLNIVHRDVNPANILVSHEGEVKVSDFGLAKARDNLEQSDSGVIKGKLSYVSPEQALGQAIDHRSDIFSLGTTLYEMICGRRPFQGQSDVEVVLKVREADFPRPSEIVSGLEPALEAIILRALKKSPDERYQTANHMREDLARYLQQLPAPPGDRELTDFVNRLFPERRSSSGLFRLTPIAHLPPTMMSVARADGMSEFQHSMSPASSPLPPNDPLAGVSLTPRPSPPPKVRGPMPTPPPRRTAAGVLESPVQVVDATIKVPAHSPSGLKALSLLLVVGAVAGGVIIAYRQLRPAPAMVSLSVTSSPSGAEVLLDGVDTSQHTPAVLMNLAVDREYQVTVRHAAAGEQRQRLRFDRRGPHAYHFELGPGKETLAVSSEPAGCDVIVDGELRGQTPLSVKLVRGRKYAVEAHRTGYRGKVVHHYAEHDQDTLRLQLEPDPEPEPEPTPKLEPRPKPRAPRPAPTKPAAAPATGSGTLEIQTEMAGQVLINDRAAGRTPGFRATLPAGTYRVMFVPDGVKIRHSATITVLAGKTHRLTLTPAPTP
jgi:eukaryotic-like serine/threonine-protein kinase